jgi:DNA-binding transcriptional MerR regulator
MAEAFMIGELASRTARTVHAIRWYETQGLMPGVQRNGGGRRVYNEQHVDWLLLMERLRRTGMSIAEMRRYTALVMQGKATLAQRRDMLAAHRARVLSTIEEWSQALTLLDSKLDFYGEWLASGHRPKTEPSARVKTSVKAPVKMPLKARPAARRQRP